MTDTKLPIYRYTFKNKFGTDFDTTGISEVHMDNVLKITKATGEVSETTHVESFTKELLIEPVVS